MAALNNLKTELRELTKQLENLDPASEAFVKLSERAGEVRDAIKNSAEAINANAGPAFERLGNQFGLVSSKLMTLDFGGAAESMRGLGSAVKGLSFRELTDGLKSFGSTLLSVGQAILANPIFLIGAAIAAIAMNFEEVSRWMSSTSAETERLSKLTGELNKAYEKQLSSVAQSVVKVEALTEAVIDNTNSETKRREALKTLQSLYPEYFKNLGDDINNTDALTDAKNRLIESIQREAKVNAAKQLLEEAYAKKFALEVQVQEAAARMGMEKVAEAAEAAKDNSQTLFSSANQAISDWINGTEGVGVAYNELQDTIANIAELERIANENIVQSAIKTRVEVENEKKKSAKKEKEYQDKLNQDKLAREKKFQDDLKAVREERLNQEEALAEEIYQAGLSAQERELVAIRDAYFEKIELARQYGLDATALIEEQKRKEAEINDKYAKEQSNQNVDSADNQTAIDKQLYKSKVQMASDAVNSLMMLNDALTNGTEKNARKAFAVNKSLSLAQAIMNTYQAVNAALTAGGNPIKLATGAQFVEAGIALTAGLANVVKISKTQFGGTSSASGGGSLSAPSTSSFSAGGGLPAFNPLNTSFLNNRPDQQPPLQAFVLNTQVSSGLEAQQRIKEQITL